MLFDVTFHPSWWHDRAGVEFNQEFFDEPGYRMDCDVRMRRTLWEMFGDFGLGEKRPERRPILGTDLLAAGYLESELFGCEIRYAPDDSPQVLCMDLDEEEIADVTAPDLDASPVWARTQRQIDELLSEFGHVLPCVNLQGIQNVAMDLMGENVMTAYYTAPEEISRLLSEITDLAVEVGHRFRAFSPEISAGVAAIVRKTDPDVYLTSNCSVEMISQDLYERFLLPWDLRLAGAFPRLGIHHCGRSMEHVVNGYAKVPGLEFAEVGAFSDVAAVRAALPGVWLNARYSPVRLRDASRSEMEREVAQLACAGREAGDRLSVSCVGIDRSVSPEKVRDFLAACRAVDGETPELNGRRA